MRSPSQLLVEVCVRVGIDADEVRDPDVRTRSVVRVRRALAYVLRVERGCSWGEVARAIGVTRESARRLCQYTSDNPPDDLAQFVRDAG